MLHILGKNKYIVYLAFVGPNIALMFSYWYDCINFRYKYVDLSILLSFELKCAFIRILNIVE